MNTDTRTARWTPHGVYDDRNVLVSRSWTADDSDYTVVREPGNVFQVLNGSGEVMSERGMLSDALDEIEALEAAVGLQAGDWVRDRWTGIWVEVVAGAQADGYTTVKYPSSGNVVGIRTNHCEVYGQEHHGSLA
jgi:hypothetical protein